MPSTSGWARSESGLLLTIKAALPLIRVRAILWNNCLMAMFSSIPWWRDKAAPILFVCSTATLWKPPRVSTATGRKEIPCSWQAWAAPSTLRLKAFSRAPPAAAEADATFDWARGPVTVTSMAPSLPSTHRRIRRSPGRATEPGKRWGASLIGARAIFWNRLKRRDLQMRGF